MSDEKEAAGEAMRETDMYPAIKLHLERRGYEVKAEVNSCDVVALRDGEAPLIVELKRGLTIGLLLQGVDRLAVSETVYVAIAAGRGPRWQSTLRKGLKLCRRLGLGLISVTPQMGHVEVHCDPGPYHPRKNNRRRLSLLREFARREGDRNSGGQSGRPVMTAYRQDAVAIAHAIRKGGPGRPAALKKELGIDRAASILLNNHYGWFARLERGVYGLSLEGILALERDVQQRPIETD